MQLIELHGVDAELHVDGWLEEERLVFLVGSKLDAYAPHLIEHLTTKLFDEALGVGLHLAHRLQCPGITLCHDIGIVDVVVAVVDDIGFKTCVGHLLEVDRHKGEICTQLVAALTLQHRSLKGDFPVGSIIFFHVHIHMLVMVVEYRLDTATVLMQFGSGMLLSFLLGFHLGRDHLAHGIVVLLDNHYIVYRGRNLKTILVLHQYNVLALEARDSSASHFTQESYFISYFHCVSVFIFFATKLHKVIAIGEIIYFIYPFRAKKRPDSASHEAESG